MKKSKPSDILAPPSPEQYQLAAKQAVGFLKESIHVLNSKKIPEHYKLIELMRNCAVCFGVVLEKHHYHTQALLTHANNCRRMDEKR